MLPKVHSRPSVHRNFKNSNQKALDDLDSVVEDMSVYCEYLESESGEMSSKTLIADTPSIFRELRLGVDVLDNT